MRLLASGRGAPLQNVIFGCEPGLRTHRFDGPEVNGASWPPGWHNRARTSGSKARTLRSRAPDAELLEASDETVDRGLVCHFAALRRFGHRCFRLERV